MTTPTSSPGPRAAGQAEAALELRWIRLQAASGLAFASFLALHIANTLVAPAGPEAYDGFQAAARGFYQHPVVELGLVLAPLALHMTASIARIVRRRRRGAPKPGLRMRLHRYTGWFLLAVIAGHVGATRGVGYFLDAPAGFGALNFTLATVPYYFVPYYIALGASGAFHLWSGLAIALRVFGVRTPSAIARGPGFWVPAGAAAALVAVAVLSLWGAFFPVDRALWGDFARVYADMLGLELHVD